MQVCSPMVSLLSIKSNPPHTIFKNIPFVSVAAKKKKTQTIYLPADNCLPDNGAIRSGLAFST